MRVQAPHAAQQLVSAPRWPRSLRGALKSELPAPPGVEQQTTARPLGRLLVGGCAVVLGGTIYLLFRPRSLLLFRWVEALGLSDFLHAIRSSWAPVRPWLPDWVVFSLPGGLWVLGLRLYLDTVWAGASGARAHIGVSLALVGGLGSEIAQALGWLPGCADLGDAALYSLGAILPSAAWWLRRAVGPHGVRPPAGQVSQ